MDPVTGEKINRLRKSYEGKLKGLGLAGRNKPVKQEPGAPGSLRHLTMWPEEEWQNQKVHGKQIKVSDIDTALQSIHSRAMQLEPGMVPNNDFWEDVLGHEKPAKTQGSGDNGKKAAAPTPGNRSALPNNMSTAAMQDSNRNRPSRGRKRHYDDNSFVGYGEGYADDDDDDNTGYHSNGEGTGKKKRKKVKQHSIPFSICSSQGRHTHSLDNRIMFPRSPLLFLREVEVTALACLESVRDKTPFDFKNKKQVFFFMSCLPSHIDEGMGEADLKPRRAQDPLFFV